MSNEFAWRSLGSVVNRVLEDAKLRAVRNGSMSSAPATPRREAAGNRVSPGDAVAQPGADIPGFGEPAQLELPFGIAPQSAPAFGVPAAPRGIRLM